MEDGERYAPKTRRQLQTNAGNAIVALFHAVNTGTSGNEDSPLVLTYKLFPDRESSPAVTYNLQLAPWWQLQPDFQYSLKPSAGIHAANAAVLGLRTTVTF